MRKSIIGIVDPVLLNVHAKSYALFSYTRSAHKVQQLEQGHCPGPLRHADVVVAAILWTLARSLAGTRAALLIHDTLQRALRNQEQFVNRTMTRRGP